MDRPDLVPAIFDLSGWYIMIILFVALLLFGRRLPEIMRGLGSSVKEFKKGMNTDEATATPATQAPAQQSVAPAAPAAPPSAPPGAVARDMSAPQPPPKV
jgi:sec-independent protein translocase protein TatA